jgi:hypothetical protein
MPKKTPSGRQSQAWKALEKVGTKDLLEAGFLSADRISRGEDFGKEIHDFEAPVELPGWKFDAKYRASHTHHTLFEECRTKYCKLKTERMVLLTKVASTRGELAVLEWDVLLELLKTAYLNKPLRARKVTGPTCPFCQKPILEGNISRGLTMSLYKCVSCSSEFTSLLK